VVRHIPVPTTHDVLPVPQFDESELWKLTPPICAARLSKLGTGPPGRNPNGGDPIRHSTSPERRSVTTGRIAINVHLSTEKKRTNDYNSKKNLEIKDQIMATTATKKNFLILLPLMRSRRFYQAKVQNYFPRPCGVVDLHLMDSEKQKLSWQILHQQKQSKKKEKRRLLLKQENTDINLTSACTRKY
jgi:hypothetical protein